MSNNIMDLFAQDEVTDIEFSIGDAQSVYERIRQTQDAVGGRPMIKAKVGAGGAKIFTVTSGNREMVVESFRGIIIAHHKCNALFPSADETAENVNTPPICSSLDGQTGVFFETGECRSCENCPHNVFGTAEKGNGKACKNMHRLYILLENCAIPVMLALPPTSLELWRNYALMDVAAAGFDMSEVVTEFSLTNALSSGGQKYSIVNFKLVGKVGNDVKEFCEAVGSAIEETPRLALSGEEYNREVHEIMNQSDDEEVPQQELTEQEPAQAEADGANEPEEVDISDL